MSKQTRAQIASMALMVGFFLLWEFLCVVFHVRDIVLPRPSQVFVTLWTERAGIWPHAFQTIYTTLIGFAFGNKINLLRLADLTAPAVPIGLFFGRIANFINGELWGRETGLPWGMVFCSPNIIAANGGDCPAGLAARHPSQLYEATLEGLVLFFILRWATHRARLLPRQGALTGLFMLAYGVFRISLENVREPDVGMPIFPFGMTKKH